jgi:hypothetical protein
MARIVIHWLPSYKDRILTTYDNYMCQGQVYNAGHSIADGTGQIARLIAFFPGYFVFKNENVKVKVKCRFRFEYWFSRIASRMDLSI